MVLICTYLMISHVEHLFMYLFATGMFSLEKCLFKSFAHLKTSSYLLLLVLIFVFCY